MDLDEFERCWPWLEPGLSPEPFRSHTKEHVRRLLERRRAFLLPAENSAHLMEVLTYPTGLRVAFGWLCGGKLEEIVARQGEVEEWSRKQGCHKARIRGRHGWQRVFTGWHEVGTEIEKIL